MNVPNVLNNKERKIFERKQAYIIINNDNQSNIRALLIKFCFKKVKRIRNTLHEMKAALRIFS
jgi:hypothetical protein